MDRKQKQRKRRSRREAFCRVVLSLLLVVAAHLVLGGLVWIKLQRTPQLPEGSGEGLRIWCMSSADPMLTLEARDFLALSDMVQEPIHGMRLASPSEYFGGSYAGGDFQTWERNKLSQGIRLGWPHFTAVLDDRLPVADLSLSCHAPVWLDIYPRLGLALSRDLSLHDLGRPWELCRRQMESRCPWRVAPRGVSVMGPVRISKYENRFWQTVEAPSLAYDVSEVLRAQPPQPGGWGQVWVEVLGAPGAGGRVHLRRSSGLKALDDLTVRWVLEQHRHLGHHHTDRSGGAGDRQQVEYRVEFGEALPEAQAKGA